MLTQKKEEACLTDQTGFFFDELAAAQSTSALLCLPFSPYHRRDPRRHRPE